MKNTIEVESENPGDVIRCISPSLGTDSRVSHDIGKNDNKIRIYIETDSIGSLRGSTDSAYKLTMLAEKILR